jgi:hypothetical protein
VRDQHVFLTGAFDSAAATFGTNAAFMPYTPVLSAANGTMDAYVLKVRCRLPLERPLFCGMHAHA